MYIHQWVFHHCLSGVRPRSSSCNRLPSNGNAAQASKEDGKKLQVEKTGAKDPLSIPHYASMKKVACSTATGYRDNIQ